MYSQKRIFNDELTIKKNVGGRLTRFKAVSGDDGNGGKQMLSFNNCQATSNKRVMKNFYLTGQIHFGGQCTHTASSSDLKVSLMKDLNNALTVDVRCNGNVVYTSLGVACTPILKSYSEKYKSPIDTDKQFDYSKKEFTASYTGSQTSYSTGTINEDINFSVPLLCPILLNGLGGVNSLTINITQDYNLYSILKFENAHTNGITAGLKNCYLSYEEYDTQSEIYKVSFPYMTFNQKQYGSNTSGGATQSSDVSNQVAVPDDVFILCAYDGSVITQPITPKSRTEKISELKVDINNDIDSFNCKEDFELYSRIKQHGYKGELIDFLGGASSVNNEFSPVIRVPCKCLSSDIGDSSIFRCHVRDVKAPSATPADCKLTLYVVYCYDAVLTLSPEKSEIKYYVNEPIIGEIQEYTGDDESDVLGSGKFFSKVKDFIKNGGISRWAGKISRVADAVAGPNNKVSGVADTVQNVASLLGASTSVF